MTSSPRITIRGKIFDGGRVQVTADGTHYYIHSTAGGPNSDHIVYQKTSDDTLKGCYGPTHSLPYDAISDMIKLGLW